MVTRRGFTLIEMLIVMAVVGLLLTVALPRYFGSLERSRSVVLKENLKVLRVSLDRYFADKGRYPETLDSLVQQRYLRAVPLDPITESPDTWVAIPAEGAEPRGVADVRSGAHGVDAQGVAYGSY